MADELRARATARGYERGTYKEKDKIRKRGIYNSTTIKDQDAILRRYVLHEPPPLSFRPSLLLFLLCGCASVTDWQYSWTLLELRDPTAPQGSESPDVETAREHCLRPEMAAPDLTTVTDFMRFYAATSDLRLDEEISAVDSLSQQRGRMVFRGGQTSMLCLISTSGRLRLRLPRPPPHHHSMMQPAN